MSACENSVLSIIPFLRDNIFKRTSGVLKQRTDFLKFSRFSLLSLFLFFYLENLCLAENRDDIKFSCKSFLTIVYIQSNNKYTCFFYESMKKDVLLHCEIVHKIIVKLQVFINIINFCIFSANIDPSRWQLICGP